MSTEILWVGRYQDALNAIVPYARDRLKAHVDAGAVSLQTQYVTEFSYLDTFLEFYDKNQVAFRPFDLLIFGVPFRAYEHLLEDTAYREQFRQLVRNFRAGLSDRRLINGRSLATVPILFTTQCMTNARVPTTLGDGLYVMPHGTNMDEFGAVTAGLLRSSIEAFRRSLAVVGYGLLPEGDRLIPYVIARDESFPGYSLADLGPAYASVSIAQQWGGWHLLDPRTAVVLRDAINAFEHLINDPAVNENNIHRFFLAHPEFLYRNEFERLWHEPQLPVPHDLTAEFLETTLKPDFVLGGRDDINPLCLVEVKLPSLELLVDNARHVAASVTKALAQLRRYKRYFENADTAETRNALFGTTHPFPKCVLLVGKLPQGQRGVTALSRIRENELAGVHLLSYDEVLSFQQRRLADFGAR